MSTLIKAKARRAPYRVMSRHFPYRVDCSAVVGNYDDHRPQIRTLASLSPPPPHSRLKIAAGRLSPAGSPVSLPTWRWLMPHLCRPNATNASQTRAKREPNESQT
ncbi:hypothetical protein E2C01_049773 [Portunus trituberculatus]|uniref:Uncharacterized protein n=1 Tax=Portunus trituberculatus TaxID=210409 RepID=A0A5B7GF86_PORTR|nr:hypothetical protein [Portunus trituberculatus]